MFSTFTFSSHHLQFGQHLLKPSNGKRKSLTRQSRPLVDVNAWRMSYIHVLNEQCNQLDRLSFYFWWGLIIYASSGLLQKCLIGKPYVLKCNYLTSSRIEFKSIYKIFEGYTLLTLKYGVNLLSAPVTSVLHQNMHAILTATGSVSAFSHSVTLTHVLLSQIISYSDTKECWRACKCDLCKFLTSYFKVNRVLCLNQHSKRNPMLYTSWCTAQDCAIL